ncbi:MAG: carbonate dehydratase [Chlorobia bacterium]|nr:carbonate dehydratase [Fimbriimonadaceae bacterium]
MSTLANLLEQNRRWAEGIKAQDPTFFQTLAAQQAPKYLWIGCSDSRVPANQIVGLKPGEVFVHRNVANIVVHTDFNCLSVIQFAVEILKVEHVMVVGHYGCGGVSAAMESHELGLIDNWLRHIKDIYSKYEWQLAGLDEDRKLDRLCELNVIEQVRNVCHTTIVQQAWRNGQNLTVHGWVYSLEDGRIRDLGVDMDGETDLEPIYRTAVGTAEGTS